MIMCMLHGALVFCGIEVIGLACFSTGHFSTCTILSVIYMSIESSSYEV